MSTENRKTEHIRICLEHDVEFTKTNGFEKYHFTHNALPELNWEDIDISTGFLGREFRSPFFIDAITGGTKAAEKINRNLAKAAEDMGIGMSVGSQRAMIEDPNLTQTYTVKETSPSVFLVGNIGASHIMEFSVEKIMEAVEKIKADALAIHINPAQEVSQEGGFRSWKGVLSQIRDVCRSLDMPVIVKEVGNGISAEVAKKLASAGVAAINIAGAGGTSWVKVDSIIGKAPFQSFYDWGIPTAESLEQCRRAVKLPIIASGGIRNGIEAAKAISMGASLAGLALPLLKPASKSADEVKKVIEQLILELRTAMLLTSSANLRELAGKAVKI